MKFHFLSSNSSEALIAKKKYIDKYKSELILELKMTFLGELTRIFGSSIESIG